MKKSFYFKVSKPKGLTLRETLNRCLILRVRESLEKGSKNFSKMYGPYGGVAQLGEHLLCKQGVIGSIPFISTTTLKG